MKFSKRNKISEAKNITLLMHKLFFTGIILIIAVGAAACSYSFTGASVPAHLKTISIPISVDRTGSGEANLSDDFTNELINKFLSDNTLQVAERGNADAVLECTLQSLTDAPQVVSGGENIQTRRLTIRAKVLYRDLVKKQNIFDRSFSNYGDYSESGDIISARQDAITEAIDKITEDILLGVVSNW